MKLSLCIIAKNEKNAWTMLGKLEEAYEYYMERGGYSKAKTRIEMLLAENV